MADTVYHKRSTVVTDNSPKLPTPEQLAYGELAINYADGYETISIKNSSNEITEFRSKEYVDGLNSKLDKRITTVENYTVPDVRANVLWVGTSIPAGRWNCVPSRN